MKITLIICTINRVNQIETLLKSLAAQSYKNFEVIVADQNKDERIGPVLDKYKDQLSVLHIKTLPGLSRSRNMALPFATGEIVGFPDDDCIYTDRLLEGVISFFQKKQQFEGLLVRWANSLNNGIKIHLNGANREVKPLNVFGTMSSAIFLKKELLKEIGNFDEKLGLGSESIFKGGEDYEIIIRGISMGKKFFFDDSLLVYHPVIDPYEMMKTDSSALEKYRQRIEDAGMSDFYIFKKYFSLLFRLRMLTNNTLGLFLNILKGNKLEAKKHYYRTLGMLKAILYFKSV